MKRLFIFVSLILLSYNLRGQSKSFDQEVKAGVLKAITSEAKLREFNKGFDAWKEQWEFSHGFKRTSVAGGKVGVVSGAPRPINPEVQIHPRIYSGGIDKLPDSVPRFIKK